MASSSSSPLFVFSSCFLRLSSLSEKLMPCRLCLLSWHAIRVQRLWIIRRCSARQINNWAESCFIISNTETTHIVDSTFRIQEEQLNRNDVLQMCYVFDIKPVKDKSRCDAEADCSLSHWGFFFGGVSMCFGRYRERDRDALRPMKPLPVGECFLPRGDTSCWAACGCHKKMNYYLTRKLRVMGTAFFEKSWSRTLRSICNHLRWPLQNSTKQWQNLHIAPQLHPHVHRRWWFTYLSFRKASPKNSFSLRLKCEETKSRSSYDSSLGWKKIIRSWTLPVTLNIRWPSLDKQLQQFPH